MHVNQRTALGALSTALQHLDCLYKAPVLDPEGQLMIKLAISMAESALELTKNVQIEQK